MKFNLKLLPRKELKQITTESGSRTYVTPDGEFRSVTTVLGAAQDKSGLLEWRKRVGEEAANKVTRIALSMGTKMHTLAESYLLGQETPSNTMPDILGRFMGIQEFLDKHVTDVYGIEYPLYSERLKAAGTTDLICLYDGKLTIVDFKTSKKLKKEEWIQSYFLQSTCYGMMLDERCFYEGDYKLLPNDVEQVVIMISVENVPSPQIFIRNPEKFKGQVEGIFIRGEKFK